MNPVFSRYNSVCSVQCVLCSVCSVQCVLYSVLCTVCVLYSVCSVQCVLMLADSLTADTCGVVMKVAMIVANTTVDSLRDIFSMWLWKDDSSLLLQFSLSKYSSGLVLGGNVGSSYVLCNSYCMANCALAYLLLEFPRARAIKSRCIVGHTITYLLLELTCFSY